MIYMYVVNIKHGGLSTARGDHVRMATIFGLGGGGGGETASVGGPSMA